MTNMNSTSKCWCITINGTHNVDHLNNVKNWEYLVAGKEIAKSGTRHLQCFVIYKTRTKFSTVKRQLPTAHIERMMGTSQQAADYCMKDGNYVEFGVLDGTIAGYGGKNGSGGKQAKVNYDKIISMAENHDFKGIRAEDPGVYFRSYHTIKRIAMDNPRPTDNLDKLENEWIWGATGLGKSSNARIENPGLYIKSHNKWWLGYRGEDVVLIDDISKTEAQWFGEHLKQWADHYPFPSETKGDGMVIRPKKIIVTSNYSIDELWGHDDNLCDALKRRFKERHIIQPFPQFVAPKVAPAIIMDDDFASHSAQSEEEYEEVDISTDNEEIDENSEDSMTY